MEQARQPAVSSDPRGASTVATAASDSGPLSGLASSIGRAWENAARIFGAGRGAGGRWAASRHLQEIEAAVDAGAKLFVVRPSPGGMLFEWVNPAFEAATGLSLAEIGGRQLDEVLPAAVAVTLTRRCRDCIVSPDSRRYVSILPLADRTLRWSMELASWRPDGKRDLLVVGAAQEVEAPPEKVAESPAEARSRLAFTALPDGRLEHVDERAFDYLGLPRGAGFDQMLARIHPEDRERLRPSPATAGGRDASVAVDARVLAGDGAYRRLELHAELFKGPAGRRWYGAAVDATDEKPSPARPGAAGEHLFEIIRSLDGCCATVDRQARIQRITPAGAAWLGMTEAQLTGLSLHDDLAPPQAMLDALQVALDTGRPARAAFPSLIHPGRWTESCVFPFEDGADLVFWDMAANQRVGQTPVEVFRELAESLPAEMALLDAQGRLVAGNAAWRSIDGDPDDDLVGEPYSEICRRLVPGLDEPALRRAIGALTSGRTPSLSLSYLARAAHDHRHRELRITPFDLAGQRSFVAAHSDVADGLAGKTQDTGEALLAVQEAERQRIAIELHDSTSQHLVALGLGVARLRRLVGGRRGTERVLADMSKSVEEAVKEIRVLSYLMMPPGLQKDGLEATVRAFLKGFGTRTGLHASFSAEGDVDNVSSAVKHAALRVVQEALSNVYRHAEAHDVAVELARSNGALVVRVADDGKGIPSVSSDASGLSNVGVGIAGMRARVSQLGGTLQIASDGAGAVVTATLPAFAGTGGEPAPDPPGDRSAFNSSRFGGNA